VTPSGVALSKSQSFAKRLTALARCHPIHFSRPVYTVPVARMAAFSTPEVGRSSRWYPYWERCRATGTGDRAAIQREPVSFAAVLKRWNWHRFAFSVDVLSKLPDYLLRGGPRPHRQVSIPSGVHFADVNHGCSWWGRRSCPWFNSIWANRGGKSEPRSLWAAERFRRRSLGRSPAMTRPAIARRLSHGAFLREA
jgi:hypothetical protein